jgi:hypothetical protein
MGVSCKEFHEPYLNGEKMDAATEARIANIT